MTRYVRVTLHSELPPPEITAEVRDEDLDVALEADDEYWDVVVSDYPGMYITLVDEIPEPETVDWDMT